MTTLPTNMPAYASHPTSTDSPRVGSDGTTSRVCHRWLPTRRLLLTDAAALSLPRRPRATDGITVGPSATESAVSSTTGAGRDSREGSARHPITGVMCRTKGR